MLTRLRELLRRPQRHPYRPLQPHQRARIVILDQQPPARPGHVGQWDWTEP